MIASACALLAQVLRVTTLRLARAVGSFGAMYRSEISSSASVIAKRHASQAASERNPNARERARRPEPITANGRKWLRISAAGHQGARKPTIVAAEPSTRATLRAVRAILRMESCAWRREA